MSTAPEADLEGTQIAGYKLLDEIHRGGQGVVYRAIQLGTKRQVALKLLLEGPLASESARRRFEREVELAASLRHSCIVTILDSGVSDGRYYFAMEFIDGLRLDRYLAQVRPPLRDTLRLFGKICDAINFAHQRGVIHRDLKPPNILVDETGEPHVLDFGLAKPVQQVDAQQSTIQVVSVAGQLLGTVAYMSPEQTIGPQNVDVRSDVYSLGVVFYESLLGRLPYSVDGPLGEVLRRIAQDEPQPPRTMRKRSRFGQLVDDELETILLKTLEKDPSRRYQTAGDLGRDLRHLLSGKPIEAKRASGFYVFRKTLKRYRLQATAASVILLMMIVFLVVSVFMWRSAREAAERADLNRTEALNRAIEKQIALQDLERAIVRQTIQRGDLAQAGGDLIAARDFYWDAYQDSNSSAALWALRQYYRQTGDVGASIVTFDPRGPSALSPNGRIVAVCESAQSIAIRNAEDGQTIGWRRAPGRTSVVNVDDQGNICAAGPGWARLWKADSLMPAVAGELDSDFHVLTAHSVSDGQGLLLVGQRQVLYLVESGRIASVVKLGGRPTGNADYSPKHKTLAIATEQGVQQLSLTEDGQMHSELIGPRTAQPRAVRFSGDHLLAVSRGSTYVSAASGAKRGQWRWLAPAPEDWELVDLRYEANIQVFGLHDGLIKLYRDGKLAETWQAAGSELVDLRLTADAERVITMDGTGALTRWDPRLRKREDRQLLERPPLYWAGAEDGSAVLLADERQRVYAYAPQHSDRVETISSRRPFRFTIVGPEEMALALSTGAEHTVICTGSTIRLRDRRTRMIYSADWSEPEVSDLQQVAITGDGRLLAFCARTPAGDRQQISFWKWQPQVQTRRNVELPTLLPRVGSPIEFVGSVIRQITFVPGSPQLLVARSNGELLLLEADHDPATSQPLEPWQQLDSPALKLAFDRQGARLAAACEDGYIRILSTSDGQLISRIRSAEAVQILAFSPHGDTLLVRAQDGNVNIFEVTTAEPVAEFALGPETDSAFVAWIGDDDALLLGYHGGVYEHLYDNTDTLIERTRNYAGQRSVARYLSAGELPAAWKTSARLQKLDPIRARCARVAILETALRRRRQVIPADWPTTVLDNAPPLVYVRLGHAAYDGERYQQAGQWLRTGSEGLGRVVDAYTALRIAQCDYLVGKYEQASAQLAQLLERKDFDAEQIPTTQLQQTAALVLAGRLPEARAVARRIGALRRDSPRTDVIATTSAGDIAYYLTGLESESPAAAFIQRYLVGAVAAGVGMEGVLRFHDDGHFFQGELARQSGKYEEAAKQYQRCIDVARDSWPANWARYRLRQLSDLPQ